MTVLLSVLQQASEKCGMDKNYKQTGKLLLARIAITLFINVKHFFIQLQLDAFTTQNKSVFFCYAYEKKNKFGLIS